jgi:hypothetical protein
MKNRITLAAACAGMLALSAGLYSVPMYALIQMRSQPSQRARIIAANNILNAIFMIASSVIAGLLLGAGFSIPEIFMLLAIANAIVDALSPFGITHLDIPITPYKIFKALKEKQVF